MDNAIHRINHYPVDSVVCFVNMDSVIQPLNNWGLVFGSRNGYCYGIDVQRFQFAIHTYVLSHRNGNSDIEANSYHLCYVLLYETIQFCALLEAPIIIIKAAKTLLLTPYVFEISINLLAFYLTIRPVARKGYRSIAHEAKPNGLLTRGP